MKRKSYVVVRDCERPCEKVVVVVQNKVWKAINKNASVRVLLLGI